MGVPVTGSNLIKNYNQHGVECPTKGCIAKLCYVCLGKTFMLLLTVNGDILYMSSVQCAFCRDDGSLVVRASGPQNPLPNINTTVCMKSLLIK